MSTARTHHSFVLQRTTPSIEISCAKYMAVRLQSCTESLSVGRIQRVVFVPLHCLLHSNGLFSVGLLSLNLVEELLKLLVGHRRKLIDCFDRFFERRELIKKVIAVQNITPLIRSVDTTPNTRLSLLSGLLSPRRNTDPLGT